jgi:hypothetical protein
MSSLDWFNFIVDIIFCLDIGVAFHTGFVIKINGEDILQVTSMLPRATWCGRMNFDENVSLASQDNHWSIAERYFRGWFCVDLVSSIPLERFVCLAIDTSGGSEGGGMYFIRLQKRCVRSLKAADWLLWAFQGTWTPCVYSKWLVFSSWRAWSDSTVCWTSGRHVITPNFALQITNLCKIAGSRLVDTGWVLVCALPATLQAMSVKKWQLNFTRLFKLIIFLLGVAHFMGCGWKILEETIDCGVWVDPVKHGGYDYFV